jgi:hypothetical protein
VCLNVGLVAGTPGGLYRVKLWLRLLGALGLATTCVAIATRFISAVGHCERVETRGQAGVWPVAFAFGGTGLFFRYASRKASKAGEQQLA